CGEAARAAGDVRGAAAPGSDQLEPSGRGPRGESPVAGRGCVPCRARLVTMPDDPRLDSFPEFKGMLGQLEERPTVDPEEDIAFEGAEKIASTQKLWERLTRDSRERVDSRAFLAARLLDVFVGDWDRHPDQWRWARFEQGDLHVSRPMPRAP